MRDSVADVGQLYNVTKHERFHGHGQKCGRRTGPSSKIRNDIGLFQCVRNPLPCTTDGDKPFGTGVCVRNPLPYTTHGDKPLGPDFCVRNPLPYTTHGDKHFGPDFCVRILCHILLTVTSL